MTKGLETKSEILKVATEMASIRGLAGLSIGELAAKTGMSKSGLFAHFGSKENLQIETLKAAANEFVAVVISPALEQEPGLARIEVLFENWLAWASRRQQLGGCIFVAASVEMDDRDGPVRDYLVWAQGEWLKILARAAERAVALSVFRHDLDTRQFAYDAYSTMLGFHHANRLMRDPKAGQRARAAFSRIITDALIKNERSFANA